jgi:hypothetical protein
MGDVVDLPVQVTMRACTKVDGGKWSMTEELLNDPLAYRRLVRTQIEELLALHAHYPLPELESVRQILVQLQQAYSDVTPFDRPLMAEFDERRQLISVPGLIG